MVKTKSKAKKYDTLGMKETCLNCGKVSCDLAGIGNEARLNENNGCWIPKTKSKADKFLQDKQVELEKEIKSLEGHGSLSSVCPDCYRKIECKAELKGLNHAKLFSQMKLQDIFDEIDRILPYYKMDVGDYEEYIKLKKTCLGGNNDI